MATKKTQTNKSKNDLDMRLKTYFKREEELLESLQISRKIILNFPRSANRRPSLLGRIGIWLVTADGGVIDTEFADLRNKK